MDWTEPIDAYCERTDASFWSEPVNAISNGAFIAAALAAIWLWRARGVRDIPVMILIVIVIAIGIGSFLFHTLANRWTLLADVVPITLFIYVYFFIAMRRFFALGVLPALGLTVAFFALSAGIGALLPRGFANGSGSYFPALLAILGVGALLRSRMHVAAGPVLLAGAVFAMSLTARSVDRAVCDAFPLGTHFLWHGLNGVVLLLLVMATMRARDTALNRPVNTAA